MELVRTDIAAQPGLGDRAGRRALGRFRECSVGRISSRLDSRCDGRKFAPSPGSWAQSGARSRNAAKSVGCEWLHVDFDAELLPFYVDACGFVPTNAGLISLG